MTKDNFYRLIVLVALVVVVLPISLTIYHSAYSVPIQTTAASTGVISNPDVLREVLPQSVVDDVNQKVQAYATQQNTFGDTPSYIASNTIGRQNGAYQFSLTPVSGGAKLSINVVVANLSGILSITTYVNGKTVTAPTN